MKNLSGFPKLDRGEHLDRILLVADSYGRLSEKIAIAAYNAEYLLGSIDSDALVCIFEHAIAVWDSRRSMLYWISEQGGTFVLDVEDDQISEVADKLVVFSESGLSILGSNGGVDVDFAKLPWHVISMDFSSMTTGKVTFTLGDSRLVEMSVDELATQYGADIAKSIPEAREKSGAFDVYGIRTKNH